MKAYLSKLNYTCNRRKKSVVSFRFFSGKLKTIDYCLLLEDIEKTGKKIDDIIWVSGR